MNRFILTVTLIAGSLIAVCGAAQSAPVFVGSYQVDGGGAAPAWPTNPICYTPQEAAALLFGGLPSDYLISVDPSLDPTTITGTGHEDGWSEPDTIFAQDFKLQTGSGYNDPGGKGTAWSAYVLDHFDTNTNYVWRADINGDNGGDAPATPEPCSLALLGMGGLPLWLRRRSA